MYINLLPLAQLPPQSAKVVKLGNKKIALFHYNEKITAIGNPCLHRGRPLA